MPDFFGEDVGWDEGEAFAELGGASGCFGCATYVKDGADCYGFGCGEAASEVHDRGDGFEGAERHGDPAVTGREPTRPVGAEKGPVAPAGLLVGRVGGGRSNSPPMPK